MKRDFQSMRGRAPVKNREEISLSPVPIINLEVASSRRGIVNIPTSVTEEDLPDKKPIKNKHKERSSSVSKKVVDEIKKKVPVKAGKPVKDE